MSLPRHICWTLLVVLGLTACEGTTFNSSVPTSPVQLVINTEAGEYVHFVTDNIGEYIIVDATGYHYHNKTIPLTNTDYYGYAGVLIYITHDRQYAAFDLCCPHCLKRTPCYLDGFFVVCPACGEQYDVSHGYATPVNAVSKEALRKYNPIYSNHRLTIRN